MLLEIEALKTQFQTMDGDVKAVNGISYQLDEGETLGIVGESGCGKSVGVMSLLRLIPMPPGKIMGEKVLFEGRDLLKIDNNEMSHIRGNKIAMIFQEPMTSLNPVLTIGQQVGEAMEYHLGMSKSQTRKRAIELLDMVGIPSAVNRLNDYPHQFSGGMRQRVMIAMALSCNPKLLIADEPTTALDVTIQAQIVDLIKKLRDEFGMAIIWITHDLGVLAGLAERMLVMYVGYIIEDALVNDLYSNPLHPYTLGLLNSLPCLNKQKGDRLTSIEGMPPDLINLPKGCPFYQRCKFKIEKCFHENPSLNQREPKHKVACWVEIENVRKA